MKVEEVFESEKSVLNAIKTCQDRIEALQKEYKLEINKWHSHMNGGQFVQRDYSLYSQYKKLKQDIEDLRTRYISSLNIKEGFKNDNNK